MATKVVSVKAELAVLRGLCHKDKKVAGTLVRQIDASYFYSDQSVELYGAIVRHLSKHGEPPTYKLLLDDPELSSSSRSFFKDSVPTVKTMADAEKAASTLNKYRQARGLYNLSAYIQEQLKSSKMDIDGALQKTATAINVIRSKKSTSESFLHFGKNNSSVKMVQSLLYDDNTEELIPTGIKAFDDEAGGFSRGSLVTIGANSGGGKSTVANAMAIKMATMGYKVLLVPLEMSKREMTARTIANVTKTNLTKILRQKMTQEEKDKVFAKYKRWVKKVKEKNGRYTIYKPDEDMTIEEIMAAISAFDVDVVIIDYISLLKGVDGDDQWRALGAAARYAKINAENMNRVNILLCQVSDEGKIRYARAISEHSSNSFIWAATPETKETGITKIDQPKSRNSLSFPFFIKIDYATMRIEDVEMDDTLGDTNPSDDKGKDRDRDKDRDKKKKKKLKNLAESDV